METQANPTPEGVQVKTERGKKIAEVLGGSPYKNQLEGIIAEREKLKETQTEILKKQAEAKNAELEKQKEELLKEQLGALIDNADRFIENQTKIEERLREFEKATATTQTAAHASVECYSRKQTLESDGIKKVYEECEYLINSAQVSPAIVQLVQGISKDWIGLIDARAEGEIKKEAGQETATKKAEVEKPSRSRIKDISGAIAGAVRASADLTTDKIVRAANNVTAWMKKPKPVKEESVKQAPEGVKLSPEEKAQLLSDVGEVIAKAKSATELYDEGIDHFNKKEYKQAIESFRDAIALNPNDWKYYHSIGLCCKELGIKEEVDKWFSRAEAKKKEAAQKTPEAKPKRRWIELNLFNAMPGYTLIKNTWSKISVKGMLRSKILRYTLAVALIPAAYYGIPRVGGAYLDYKYNHSQVVSPWEYIRGVRAVKPRPVVVLKKTTKDTPKESKAPAPAAQKTEVKAETKQTPQQPPQQSSKKPITKKMVVKEWIGKDGTKHTKVRWVAVREGKKPLAKADEKAAAEKIRKAEEAKAANEAEKARKAEFKKALEAVTDSRVRLIIEGYEEGTAQPGKEVWKGRDGAYVRMDSHDANELMKSIYKAWSGTKLPGSKKGIEVVRKGRTVYILVNPDSKETKAEQEHAKMMKAHAESVAAFNASTSTAKAQ